MKRKINPSRVFIQHGFSEIETTGTNQIRGICPFCFGEKFFINPENKKWDCKKCGRSGGYKKFLKSMNSFCQEHFKGRHKKWLVDDRGISGLTFKKLGIGYNPLTHNYTFPMYEMESDDIWNLYIYNSKNRKFIGTAGAKQGLIGWERYNNQVKVIWLTEGHWDYAVMSEILEYMEKDDEIVMAVPGANTFHEEWGLFLQNKIVFVCFDADKDKIVGDKVLNAGRDGALKVYNMVNRVANEIKFVHWHDNVKDGYDLRDNFKENNLDEESTYKFLTDSLHDYPKGVDLSGTLNGKEKVAPEVKYTGNGLDPSEVYQTWTKWMKLKSTEVIDVFYGALIANRLPGDPVWLFLVGASGCGKSEFLLSIKNAKDIYSIDSLTPHTLVSGSQGSGGSDPSLIPQIDGMVLCIKDFTTILEMNSVSRDDIFGQFRSAYDGEFSKPFGVGILRSYESKFGIVSGVTRAIELHTERYTALGERFLRYIFPISKSPKGRQDVILRAINNVCNKDKDKMRRELRELSANVLNYHYGAPPKMSDKIAFKIAKLSDWVSTMRGAVIRDAYTKDITHFAFQELGTRLGVQLSKLLFGITLFRRKSTVTELEYEVIKNIAIGCLSSKHEKVLSKMYKKQSKWFAQDEIYKMLKLPNITIKRILEDFYALNVVDRKMITGLMIKYKIKDDICLTMKGAEIYA